MYNPRTCTTKLNERSRLFRFCQREQTDGWVGEERDLLKCSLDISIQNVGRFCEHEAHRCVNSSVRTVVAAALGTVLGLVSQVRPVTIQLRHNRGVALAPTFPAPAVRLGDVGEEPC